MRLINVSRHVCVCTINTTKKQDELLRAFFFLSLSFLSLSLERERNDENARRHRTVVDTFKAPLQKGRTFDEISFKF